MANIRIDLDYPVINGQSVTFKSPANCSDISGLIVYYPADGVQTSTVFSFADARGNNIGDVDLFAENVLVKVILDTELKRAYIQNADFPGRFTKEGGEIFNDYANNKAISEYSTAFGQGTSAGLKGYYWTSIDPNAKTITLSTNQTSPVGDFDIDWEAGDIISIRNFHTPIVDAAVIKSINKNVIEVEELPFTEREDSTGLAIEVSDFGVWVSAKPNKGLVDLSIGATSSGVNTLATGFASHTEGYGCIATDIGTHAEGKYTEARGAQSHAEGNQTKALGSASHAEGYNTTAEGKMAHSEGSGTYATGDYSHAEGRATRANGLASHVEGRNTRAYGDYQHVQGKYNIEDHENKYAHIVGGGDETKRKNIHTLDWDGNAWFEGDVTVSDGVSLVGVSNSIKNKPGRVVRNTQGNTLGEAFNAASVASGLHSHAEGYYTLAKGDNSHAEGHNTETTGSHSHAEGYFTQAKGDNSHSEGSNTTAKGTSSHAEGYNTTAEGTSSHSEGTDTQATNTSAHAEGNQTIASGASSHTEGNNTRATASSSHAEGYKTQANGKMSHTEGTGTIATSENQHVQGRYNIPDYQIDKDGKIVYDDDGNPVAGNNYLHIVGNGSFSKPSNAHTLDWDGNAWYAGTIEAAGAKMTDDIAFGNRTKGLSWEDDDGNIFYLRPHTPTGEFQVVVKNPTINNGEFFAPLTINADGRVQIPTFDYNNLKGFRALNGVRMGGIRFDRHDWKDIPLPSGNVRWSALVSVTSPGGYSALFYLAGENKDHLQRNIKLYGDEGYGVKCELSGLGDCLSIYCGTDDSTGWYIINSEYEDLVPDIYG